MKDYSQMFDAYRKVYENVNQKHDTVMPGRPLDKPYVGPGEVQKAHSHTTYPAGFDPTGREDMTDTKNESVDQLELVGDFLIENGFISDIESVDAFYAHMSDEWKSQILEKADDNGNTSCWDSHKKVGMKKKGGKMVNNCVPK